jgi:Sigma-54 interaction domain
VARIIHDSGPRDQGPFLDMNCAAIPKAVLEAGLFGYGAGGFTDARCANPASSKQPPKATCFWMRSMYSRCRRRQAAHRHRGEAGASCRRSGGLFCRCQAHRGTQAELSSHDMTAESPATCIVERYVSLGGKTWHVRGNFGEFLRYFWVSIVNCDMMRAGTA